MMSFSILLTSVKDVKAFVEAASHQRCDVDVLADRYIVNGKSIMGLFSIDLAKPVTVQVHGTDNEAQVFRTDVAAYVVE